MRPVYFLRRRQLRRGQAPQPTSFAPLAGQRTGPHEPLTAPAEAWGQAKLTVSQPGDAHEQEADRMAEYVVQRRPVPDGEHQLPLRDDQEKQESQSIQRLSAGGAAPASAVSVAAPQLGRTRGQGRPLPPATLAQMSQAFGHDFSAVRIHTGSQAEQLSRGLQAQAFTTGTDVYFGAGKYDPASTEGRRLLAHELTHVVQQRGAAAGRLQRYPVPGNLACAEVVGWLDTNSPYLPAWAVTRCEYTFNGQAGLKVETPAKGVVKVTATGTPRLSVAVACPIDSPDWQPDARPNQAAEAAAWQAMKTTLMAHEQRHVQLGEQYRAKMTASYQAVSVTATGPTQELATAQLQDQLAALQQQWVAEAQAAQDALDTPPFRGAVLVCPPAPAPPPTPRPTPGKP